MLRHAAEIAAATDLPVSADLENCYADDPDGVADTIRLAAKTGFAVNNLGMWREPEDSRRWQQRARDSRFQSRSHGVLVRCPVLTRRTNLWNQI